MTAAEYVIRRAVAACVAAAYGVYIERMGRPPGPMLDDYAEVIARHRVFVIAGWYAATPASICGKP